MVIAKEFYFFMVILCATRFYQISSDCAMLNYCNGHGICNGATSVCECFEGFGAPTDITLYRAPDCSALTCPSAKAWGDVPSSSTVAHAFAECSNKGKCDRLTGSCKCHDGFTGDACQRMQCPNECSGHGQCVSISQMAKMDNAFPLNNNTYYEGEQDSVTWDEDMIYGCVCDSSWTVGLAAGQRQMSEWFGPDCSQRRCPSGDDPGTVADETDCHGVIPSGGRYAGSYGNLCHVDCANRGICDHTRGVCNCFDGNYGHNCTLRDAFGFLLSGSSSRLSVHRQSAKALECLCPTLNDARRVYVAMTLDDVQPQGKLRIKPQSRKSKRWSPSHILKYFIIRLFGSRDIILTAKRLPEGVWLA
eukprot:gene12858-27113_t